MPATPPAHCYRCGRPGRQDNPISWRGNCRECGERAALESVEQLRAKAGPFYDRWLTGILAAARRRRLDRRATVGDTRGHA